MAPLTRKTATDAGWRWGAVAPPAWDLPRQPPCRRKFLLVGTSTGEEIPEGISKEQALGLVR
jgi:hypothetical protein